MNRLKSKAIIVTGAALGIGRAASLLLAPVAITDLKDAEGKDLVG